MDVLNIDNIFLDVAGKTRKDVFEFLAKKATENSYADNVDAIVEGFFAREKLGSTGMKAGFAIPHVKHATVKNTAVMIAKLRDGVSSQEWETFDEKPVDIVIALLIPESGDKEDVKLLTSLSSKLVRAEFQKEVRERNTAGALFEYLTAQIVLQK